MNSKAKFDKLFLYTTIALLSVGLLIFLSASLSLLSKDPSIFNSKLMNQIGLGLGLGSLAAFFLANIHYKVLGKFSVWIYIISVILIALVFVPGLGFGAGGAKRWLNLGPIPFQPVELMKISYILFLSMWFYYVKDQVKTFKRGMLAYLVITGIPASILFLQPDMDNTMIMAISGFIIYAIAGAEKKHLGMLIAMGAVAAVGVAFMKPYILERVMTFMNPGEKALTSSFQINQSLIAIGSGEIFGKGFGQSLQKFKYLPEPMSDSIFAVASEEFGFVGSITIIFLFTLFLISGLRIARRCKDDFGRLTALGLVIMIVSQSFLNIASMLGLFPLSGLPLLFISHGGTALFFTMCAVGIILNISKNDKKI